MVKTIVETLNKLATIDFEKFRNQKKKTMKKAILYTRISTDEQANNGYSLQHQKALLQQHYKMKDVEILEHYEKDYSAKTFDRPEIKKVFEHIRKK